MLQCAAMCCSVLQRLAALQRFAALGSILHRVAACCSASRVADKAREYAEMRDMTY